MTTKPPTNDPEQSPGTDGQAGHPSLSQDVASVKVALAEAAVRAAPFKAIFDAAPQAMLLVDRDAIVVALNQAARAFVGRADGRALDLPCGEALACEHVVAGARCGRSPQCAACIVRSSIERTLDAGRAVCNAEGQLTAVRDGKRITRDVMVSTSLVSTGDGPRVLVSLSDATKTHRAQSVGEQMLRESEKKYRRLFTEMLNGFALHEIICDDAGRAVDYVTLEVNAAYESLLNTPRAAVIGEKASEILPREELDHWLGIFGPVALTGQSARYEMHSPSNSKCFEGTAYCPEKGRFAVTFTDVTDRRRTQEALRQEHSLITSIMETSPVAIVQVDAAGQITYANRRAEEVLGLTGSDVLGRAYNDPEWKIRSADGKAFPDEGLPFRVVQRTLKPAYGIQHAIEWPDGRRLILAINATPLMDSAGRFQGMVAAMEDVTERTRTAMALAESETRYRNLFNSILDGFAVHEIVLDESNNPVDYRFLAVNPAFEQMTGLAAADIVGKTVMDVMPGTERYWVETYGKVAMTGVPARFENYSKLLDKHFEVLAFQPRPGQFACVFRDVTQRKEAEVAIRESERRYKSLVDNVGLGVILVGPDYRIRSVNPAQARLFGKAPEDFVGKACFQEFEKRQAPCPDCPGKIAMETGRPAETDRQGVRDDGLTHMARVQAFPLFDSFGTASTFIEVVEDITERKRAEEALHDSQHRYRRLFETISDAIFIVDCETGLFVDANAAALNLYGYSREEFLLLRNTAVSAEPALTRQAVAAQQTAVPLRWHRKKDGTTFPVEISGSYFESRGRRLHVAAVRDISERKRAEKSLRESEEALRKAQRVAHVGSWAWHIQSNRLDWSDEMYRIFGIDKTEFTGDLKDVIAKAIHPEDRAKVNAANLRVAQESKPVPLEYRVLWPDQTVRVVWAEAGELMLDEAGNPATLTGIVQDVTERRHAEQSLRESAERLDLAMRSSRMGAFEWDIVANKRHWDPTVHLLLGTRSETFSGTPEEFLGILHPDDRKSVKDDLSKALQGEHYETSYRVVWPDGSVHHIAARGRIHRDGANRPVRMLGVCWDVSEHKRAEAQLVSHQDQLRRMAADMAAVEERERRRIAVGLHDEVGQNIAALRLNLQLLRKADLAGDDREVLEDCMAILTQVGKELRTLVFDLCPPSLYELGLGPALAWFMEKFQDKTTMTFALEDKAEGEHLSDDVRALAFQTARELIVNAVKHSGARNVTVRIDQSDQTLWVCVSDDGIGFDPETMAYGKSTKSGFGLFGVRERLSHAGGHLEVKSREGEGSQLTIVLPTTQGPRG